MGHTDDLGGPRGLELSGARVALDVTPETPTGDVVG